MSLGAESGRPLPELAQADPARSAQTGAGIKELNEFISVTGESIEGNVCYWHGTTADEYRKSPPTDDGWHVAKRANLATLAGQHSSMLEVGLNGGHSALICLLANPSLYFFSVDICGHEYTLRAAEFLKAKFHRRFHFFRGDSRDVLPKLFVTNPLLKFDLLHIDGGHGADLAYTDISNAMRMAAPDATLIYDDVNAPHLNEVLEDYIRLGWVKSRSYQGLFRNPLHEIVSVS